MRLLLSVVLKNLKEMADPRNLPFIFREIYGYAKDLSVFKKGYRHSYPIRIMPVLFEKTSHSSFDPQYTYQAYWAATHIVRKRAGHNGQPHIDVSSNVSFVAQLCALTDVIQVEYRPPELTLPSYKKISGDILRLPFSDHSVFSLSCLHVVEHIGLGRYGDKINVKGCWDALSELERVMAPGGWLYLSVPVGKACVYFNGCYVFNAVDIITKLAWMNLADFAYINDQGVMIEKGQPEDTIELTYGLGLFLFEKQKMSPF
jgi:hypothetical protein